METSSGKKRALEGLYIEHGLEKRIVQKELKDMSGEDVPTGLLEKWMDGIPVVRLDNKNDTNPSVDACYSLTKGLGSCP